MKRRYVILLLLLGAGGAVWAQEERPLEIRRALPVTPTPSPSPSATEPEIRRALPVIKSTPPPAYQNPAWIQQVPTPTPAPRQPGPEPGFTPYRPMGRVEVQPTTTPAPGPAAPPADNNGVIRISPTVTAEQTSLQDLDTANGLYSRKMYDLAIPAYEKFLAASPGAPNRDQALFRVAESYRLMGKDFEARDAYRRLLREFQKGEFAGAAAFRLGEYLFADHLYGVAATQFQLAADQSPSAEVRLSALYNQGRCLQMQKQPQEAIAKYREVIAMKGDNPYSFYAQLYLAELTASIGQKKEALQAFDTLLAGANAPTAVRAEAAIKGASLAAELGDNKKAAGYFTEALKIPDLGDWKPIAILGAMRADYATGDYQGVIDLNTAQLDSLPDETKAEALLLTANSYRQKGNAAAAKAVYDRLITSYPEAGQSQDARFQKLLSMYQLNDPQTAAEADAFLAKATDEKQRGQATLLKAETLFKQEKFGDAAPAYAEVAASKLDKDIKSQALFKYGWCLMKIKQFSQAAEAFSDFMERYPNDASYLSALSQRGLARQEMKDYDGALKDFDQIIAKPVETKDRELALQQKALILGQKNDYDGMAKVFTQLLADYPKSAAAAQANFWIGWAAFEKKNYPEAITSLAKARELDPKSYGDRAGLRIALGYYYQQDRKGLTEFLAKNPSLEVPTEIVRWLGRQSFAEGDYAKAEQYLLPAAKDPKNTDPEVLIELAEAQIMQGKAGQAEPYIQTYLSSARDPRTRARALIAQGRVNVSKGQYEDAVKVNDEALLLQPEGKLNAEGRLLSAEIATARGNMTDAAKAYMTIAVLYDDPEITPRALFKAAEAYRRAGDTLDAEKASKELQERYPNFQKPGRSQ